LDSEKTSRWQEFDKKHKELYKKFLETKDKADYDAFMNFEKATTVLDDIADNMEKYPEAM
jgi:uncharacterized protein Yka (UPF0111/DUF47 family)